MSGVSRRAGHRASPKALLTLLTDAVRRDPGVSEWRLAAHLGWQASTVQRRADLCVADGTVQITVTLSGSNGRPTWCHWPTDISEQAQSCVQAAMLLTAMTRAGDGEVGRKLHALQGRIRSAQSDTTMLAMRPPFPDGHAQRTVAVAAQALHRLGDSPTSAALTALAVSPQKLTAANHHILYSTLTSRVPLSDITEWRRLAPRLHAAARTIILEDAAH